LNLKYSSDEQLARIAKSHKRNIPKLNEHELALQSVSSLDDVEEYFDILQETATRQGRKPFYRIEFYRALYTIFSRSSKLLWPKVVLNHKLLTSGIFFRHRDAVIYWDGVSSRQALELGANFFMFWEIISQVKSDGAVMFDFGASPRKSPGLKRFKSGWGADHFGYFEYNYQKPLSRLAGKLRGMI
jgi:lipid II:glycine glycyltransferase (peptidoglycan interpeptide bridge formation enzyme)